MCPPVFNSSFIITYDYTLKQNFKHIPNFSDDTGKGKNKLRSLDYCSRTYTGNWKTEPLGKCH